MNAEVAVSFYLVDSDMVPLHEVAEDDERDRNRAQTVQRWYSLGAQEEDVKLLDSLVASIRLTSGAEAWSGVRRRRHDEVVPLPKPMAIVVVGVSRRSKRRTR